MEEIKNSGELGPGKQDSRPTAQDAARRLAVLKYVVVRALAAPPRYILNAYLKQSDPDGQEEFARDAEEQSQEFWHWRSRTRELIESGEVLPPDKKLKALELNSYDDIVRFTARKGAEEGTIPACIGDDFPAYGRAYRDLSREEWIEVRYITIQRHLTLNWLCGYAPGNSWDKTPTDT